MNNNLQLVLGGSGADLLVAGFVAQPKVVRHRHTRQSFRIKGVEGEVVSLEPICGSDVSVDTKHFTADNWEIVR